MKRKDIKIMIAYERSGRVREAFRCAGFSATSCDIFPSESPGSHIIGRFEEIDLAGYDVLIAFPPCTYLTITANRWHRNNLKRELKRLDAIETVAKLFVAPVSHVAIENPVGVLSTRFRQPSQIIHPWQFGHREKKRTCLWLRGLPKLQSTSVTPKSERVEFVSAVSGGRMQKQIRSKTFLGVAEAMAKQWGDWLDKQYVQEF